MQHNIARNAHTRPMRTHLLNALLSLPLVIGIAAAQNIPDRHVTFDPLADTAAQAPGFTAFPGTGLYAEFSRYSDGSGGHHRWNARTGGYIEFARWDSVWSIAAMGMMEMVADPFSDIGFNPRAIFWEEGLVATHAFNRETALQFGYVHRCKHDIDNLEPLLLAGRREQSTLIYSGITARLLFRPRLLVDGPLQLFGACAARNEFFLHLFDQREPAEADGSGRDMNTLADAMTLQVHLSIRPRESRCEITLDGSGMVSLFGAGRGLSGRWKRLEAEFAAPGLELGLRLFNPRGGAFTLFARGERQRDGAVVPFATPAHLFMFGVRASAFAGMW